MLHIANNKSSTLKLVLFELTINVPVNNQDISWVAEDNLSCSRLW